MNRDNELEREEFDKKVKRNIKRVILILVIIFAVGFLINKIYVNYKEKLDIERDRVISSNEKILMQYIGYLNDINELIVDMICGQEVDKEYYNVFLELSSEEYKDLRDIRYNREKYDIVRLENNYLDYRCDFHGESNRSIRGLLLEDKLTKEQEEYLSEVYEVNSKIIEVYNKNLKKVRADGDRDENIYYELYYEGRMYYDLINRLYEAAEGKNFKILTKLDKKVEYPEKETRKEDIHKKTPLEYAEIISEIITKEKAEFTVSNECGDLEYTYKNDDTKHIRIWMQENSYLNYYNESITQGDMPEEQIDEKAEEIINAFGVESLKLVDKEYEDYFSSRQGQNIKFYGYDYSYYVVDDEYIDLQAFIDIRILTDGSIDELNICNLNIIDGTYKKLIPKITMEQAKSMLDDRVQQNIKSYKLIRIYDDKFIYEFEFDLYGLKLYTGVNADTGEIEFYKDTSYSRRVN